MVPSVIAQNVGSLTIVKLNGSHGSFWNAVEAAALTAKTIVVAVATMVWRIAILIPPQPID